MAKCSKIENNYKNVTKAKNKRFIIYFTKTFMFLEIAKIHKHTTWFKTAKDDNKLHDKIGCRGIVKYLRPETTSHILDSSSL